MIELKVAEGEGWDVTPVFCRLKEKVLKSPLSQAQLLNTSILYSDNNMKVVCLCLLQKCLCWILFYCPNVAYKQVGLVMPSSSLVIKDTT